MTRLAPGDRIIAVAPENCSGPGWSNTPVLVVVQREGVLRLEYLQPDEQSVLLRELFATGAAMQESLRRAVMQSVSRERSR